MIARFNGNVVPFADDATSTNRTVFGGTTQSDLIDDNLNTNFKKGWEIVGLNDNPTREDFNAMGYTLGALISYLYEMGISEWNASQNYRANSRVIGSDGIIYKAKTGTDLSPNVNNNPTTDTMNWEIDTQFDINSLVAKTTPIDSDNLAIQESGGLLKKLSFANLKLWILSLFNPTLTGTVSFNSTTNNINLTNIVTDLGLEIGDVIQISGAEDVKNNSEFTVEVITDNNNIIVNQAHANKGTTKNVATRASDTGVTIKLLAKWYNASVGLGQDWVNVAASRAIATDYMGHPNRSILVNISGGNTNINDIHMLVSGTIVGYAYANEAVASSIKTISAIISPAAIYRCDAPSAGVFNGWVELR